MTENTKLYYKTCRENAGLTQEEACFRLDISEPTTLSKYENGHLKPDQNLVDRMALLYRNARLPVWHLKHWNPALAKYIHEPKEMFSDGENVMQCEIAADELTEVYKKAKKYLKNDGVFDDEEIAKLFEKIPKMERVLSDVSGFISYIRSKAAKTEQ